MMKYIFMLICLCLLTAGQSVFAHAHIHIGRNFDQQAGTADDNTLFLFGMPPAEQPENYWPNFPLWGDAANPYDMVAEPLKLVYQDSGLFAGKYVCEWMECFHSAHPSHGNWQLGGMNPQTSPGWSIGIERVSASSGLQFWEEDTFSRILQNDGDQIIFPQLWMNDKYNESGTLGAWGLHAHVLYVVDGAGVGIGESYYATLRAVDDGTTGFTSSEAYTVRFETIPEPATLLLMACGSIGLIRRK
jgi:hypothetical protein